MPMLLLLGIAAGAAAAVTAATAAPFDPPVHDARSRCLQAPAILKGF